MSTKGGTTSTATTSTQQLTVIFGMMTALVTLATCSSVVWIYHACDGVKYSQYAFQSSIWGIDDISDNQYHPLVDDKSDDPDLCQQLGLHLYTSSPTKLQQKIKEKNCKT